MNIQNVAIAYCIDNINVAESLDQQLSPAAGQLTHLYGSRNNPDKLLTDQLLKHNGPILLLISDNYLKSTSCMLGGLHLLNEKQDQILPIVIDGQRKDKETGEPVLVPTQFDRISDMIQYINYWQDQYLDLRRQKRELSDLDEENFNEHLKSIREISSETSEFLRLLRNMEHYSLAEFSHNDFQVFFQFIGDQHAWESFQKNRLHYRMQQQAGDASSREDTDVEVIEREIPAAELPTDIDLSDIPGLDLLGEVSEDEETATMEEEIPHPQEEIAEIPEESEEVEPAGGLTDEIEEEPLAAAEEEIEVEAGESASVDTPPGPEIELEITNESTIEETLESTEEEIEEEVAPLETLLESAWNLAESDRSGEALQVLTAAQAHYPQAEPTYYQALILAQFDQNLPAAKVKLEELLAAYPQHTDGLFLLGEVAEIAEEFEVAGNSYQKLHEIAPDHKGLKYRLGMVWAHHFPEKSTEATALLAEAVQEEPDNADAVYQYGLLLNEKLGQQEEAIEKLQQTLSLSPDHPFANYDLALIYHQKGMTDEANAAYQQAIQVNPELKTPENDMAFNVASPTEETPTAIEQTALDALKQNIAQLEGLIKAREEENLKLKQARPGQDKTVFISGATSGIGRATAELFAENGYRLILNGRRNDRLEELKNTFEEEFEVAVKLLPFDISSPDAVQTSIADLGEDWQQVDILINNAGKARGLAPIHEGEFAHWDEMIDTNVKGLLYLTRAISPGMVARQSGHIINVGSAVGKEVYKNGNVYCATKFAVDGLTKAIRMDLFEHNIRVSQVSPAHVEETEFASVRRDGAEDANNIYADFQPLNAKDVAETIYFMATRPAHVNIQDVLLMGTQQASPTMINRSGRSNAEDV